MESKLYGKNIFVCMLNLHANIHFYESFELKDLQMLKIIMNLILYKRIVIIVGFWKIWFKQRERKGERESARERERKKSREWDIDQNDR